MPLSKSFHLYLYLLYFFDDDFVFSDNSNEHVYDSAVHVHKKAPNPEWGQYEKLQKRGQVYLLCNFNNGEFGCMLD